jgi:hypothetical protein
MVMAMDGNDDEFDRTVRLHVYRYFVDLQRAPSPAEAALALRRSTKEVEAAYERLAEDRVLVLQPGGREIRMAMPFSAVPTRFRVSSEGRRWWANCAWDALGIPVMLEADATIATSCADCDQPITLVVESGEVRGGGELLHFAVSAARWWDDIVFT